MHDARHTSSHILALQLQPLYRVDVAVDALWRTKKLHFRPSDEMSMKNVDKDAVNTK